MAVRHREAFEAPPALGAGDWASLEEVERAHITLIIRLVGGNRQKAAYALGVSERTLYRKLAEIEAWKVRRKR